MEMKRERKRASEREGGETVSRVGGGREREGGEEAGRRDGRGEREGGREKQTECYRQKDRETRGRIK